MTTTHPLLELALENAYEAISNAGGLNSALVTSNLVSSIARIVRYLDEQTASEGDTSDARPTLDRDEVSLTLRDHFYNDPVMSRPEADALVRSVLEALTPLLGERPDTRPTISEFGKSVSIIDSPELTTAQVAMAVADRYGLVRHDEPAPIPCGTAHDYASCIKHVGHTDDHETAGGITWDAEGRHAEQSEDSRGNLTRSLTNEIAKVSQLDGWLSSRDAQVIANALVDHLHASDIVPVA